jgi:hypothetical protein
MKKLAERRGIWVTHTPMLTTRGASTAISIIALYVDDITMSVRFDGALKVRWGC